MLAPANLQQSACVRRTAACRCSVVFDVLSHGEDRSGLAVFVLRAMDRHTCMRSSAVGLLSILLWKNVRINAWTVTCSSAWAACITSPCTSKACSKMMRFKHCDMTASWHVVGRNIPATDSDAPIPQPGKTSIHLLVQHSVLP